MGDATPETPNPGLDFELVDRLRRSLRYAGLTPKEMGFQLGVHRNTMSKWLNGVGQPSKAILVAWAAICRVSYSWLATGAADADDTPRIHERFSLAVAV